MLPPLGALRVFEAAARLSSFSRAGDELHVTHAAVSHQIRQLEAWFGRPLFLRERRGVRLSPEAAGLAATLTAGFESIAGEVERLRTRASGDITVASIPSVAVRWLIPALRDFLERHRDVGVKVIYAGAGQRLRETDADVLITVGADRSEAVRCKRLFSRRTLPVASPRYLERAGPLATAPEIAAADLLHDETRARWRDWLDKAGVPSSGRPRGPVFQDINLLAGAVLAGSGVALCPVEVFRREIVRGELVVLSDVAMLEDESYFLITRTSREKTVSSFVSWFCDAVLSDHRARRPCG
ncbi:LysR substrate-binding domain-containing protein [Chelativorans xinjiangense]|uniref:LysR substrate-binding domain-containing protein n=1 Tax=Chelativorans xinjiangense TaxID=2681485 RepID=UPI001359983B|nr:LysR substrate-binding domain-containing protein [Chelativorans xinjiangense]